MEVRKMKIGPEDEARLRELLRIHEKEIDNYTDEQLDEVEQKTSEQLQRLLQKQSHSNPPRSVLRFRFPLKTGTIAFLAVAAAMLLVQVRVSENVPSESQLVSKGTVQTPAVSCESSVVERDGTTPPHNGSHYLIKAGKISYLKLRCGRPVYVHIGFLKGERLHLKLSNLSVSVTEKVVMKGKDRVDFMALAQRKRGLIVLVTEKPLTSLVLSPKDRAGLWLEELPLAIQP